MFPRVTAFLQEVIMKRQTLVSWFACPSLALYLKAQASAPEKLERDFGRACCDRTRLRGFKLKEVCSRLGIEKKSFRMRVLQWREKWWAACSVLPASPDQACGPGKGLFFFFFPPPKLASPAELRTLINAECWSQLVQCYATTRSVSMCMRV